MILLTLQDGCLLGAPPSSLHISVYPHVSSLRQMCTAHVKAHSKMVSNEREKKIRTHVTEEPKVTHLVVSQSHLPLFFIFYHGGVQTCNPTPENLSLRLSVVMETSQVSVLPAVAPAVHCGICGSVLKPTLSGQTLRGLQQSQRTNQLLLYIVCVNARWEPSHAARRRKP